MSTLEGKGFGISDLTLLDEVTEEKANENLKLRFEKGKVSFKRFQSNPITNI